MSVETKTEKAPLTKEDKRNRIILAILSSVIILLILGGFIFGSPYSIKKNSFSSFDAMVTANYDRPTIVYCTKPSCTYCDKVTPEISKIKDKFKDQVNFYCIDVLDDGEGSAIWKKYKPGGIDAGKTGVPCVIYFYARTSADQPLDKKAANVGWGGSQKTNSYEYILKRVESLVANPYGTNG